MHYGGIGRRFTRLAATVPLVVAGVLAPATPALAAGALDQSYAAAAAPAGSVDFIHDVITGGQTFTAGVTGVLDRVDLSIGRLDDPGPLIVSIQTAAGGLPTGTVLASATVAAATVPDDGGLHDVSVALPVSVSTAGTQYAIVLAAPSAGADTAWFWAVDSLNGYAGGTALEGDALTGNWNSLLSDDRTFATTVDSAPCATGTYSPTGYGTCVPADPGSFAAGPGATTQVPCGLGAYQPAAGAASCIPAPIGTYVDSVGAVASTPCPAGTTTAGVGSTSAAACQSLDTTPPEIACNASPSVLWPPNGKLVPVTVTVTATGATAVSLVSVTADEGSAGDIQGWTIGTADTSGLLRATRIGHSRTYTLTYGATDDAGNSARCVTTVRVPHDQGHGGKGGKGDGPGDGGRGGDGGKGDGPGDGRRDRRGDDNRHGDEQRR